MSAWNLGDITVAVRGGGWVRGPEKSGGLVELCASWVRGGGAFKPSERRERRVRREGSAETGPGRTLLPGSKSQQKGLRGVAAGAGRKSRPCDTLERRGDRPGTVGATGSDAAGVKEARDGVRVGGMEVFSLSPERQRQVSSERKLRDYRGMNPCGDSSWKEPGADGEDRGLARGRSGAFHRQEVVAHARALGAVIPERGRSW